MSTRTVDLNDGSSLTFEMHTGAVIHLHVTPKIGDSATVQIGREHRDAIEAAWQDASAEQDVYHAQRTTRAVEWLTSAGLDSAKALADVGLLDVDAALARAETRDPGLINRFRAGLAVLAARPAAGPEYSVLSEDCESGENDKHKDCNGCTCECHSPDDPQPAESEPTPEALDIAATRAQLALAEHRIGALRAVADDTDRWGLHYIGVEALRDCLLSEPDGDDEDD